MGPNVVCDAYQNHESEAGNDFSVQFALHAYLSRLTYLQNAT